MLLKPISFIFRLGKHQSLKLRPLRTLSTNGESAPLQAPSSPTKRNVYGKLERPIDSNQMSS